LHPIAEEDTEGPSFRLEIQGDDTALGEIFDENFPDDEGRDQKTENDCPKSFGTPSTRAGAPDGIREQALDGFTTEVPDGNPDTSGTSDGKRDSGETECTTCAIEPNVVSAGNAGAEGRGAGCSSPEDGNGMSLLTSKETQETIESGHNEPAIRLRVHEENATEENTTQRRNGSVSSRSNPAERDQNEEDVFARADSVFEEQVRSIRPKRTGTAVRNNAAKATKSIFSRADGNDRELVMWTPQLEKTFFEYVRHAIKTHIRRCDERAQRKGEKPFYGKHVEVADD
jgi:hypothetical protein